MSNNKRFAGLYGIIIRTDVGSGQIASITTPSSDDYHYVMITNNDIKGKRFLELDGQRLEIFANKNINYNGQPTFALFGNDYEDLDYIKRQCEIEYRITDEDISDIFVKSNLFYSENFHKGKTSDIDGCKKYTSSTTLERTRGNQIINFEVRVYTEKGKTYIHTPVQDIDSLVTCVSKTCNIDKENLVIVSEDGYCVNDEFLLSSIYSSVIATLAHLKTKKSVCLLTPAISERPTTIIKRTTYVKDTVFVKQEIDVKVEQGYKCLFTQEMVKQLTAGLIPSYKVEELDINFSFYTSNYRPACFFGDLGFTAAVLSSEVHSNYLAKKLDIFPDEFRLKYYGKSNINYVKTLSNKTQKDLIEKITKSSTFDREYVSYDIIKNNLQTYNCLVEYSRGVGLASGGGIYDFSKDSNLNYPSDIAVRLTSSDVVEVLSSISLSSDTKGTYKSIIKKILNIDNVSFVKADYNSGPDVLSRDTGILAKKLEDCCLRIKRKRFKSPLPILEESRDLDLLDKTYVFQSDNLSCIVASIEVDLTTLCAKVTQIWAYFHLLGDRSKYLIKNKIKHTIVNTLDSLGLKQSDDFTINLDFTQDKELWGNFSSNSIKPLVMASCVSALSQALKTQVTKIPLTKEDILEYTRKSHK